MRSLRLRCLFRFIIAATYRDPPPTQALVPLPPVQGGATSLSFLFYHCDNLYGPSTNASVGPPPSGAGRCALQSVIFDKVRSPHSRIKRLCGDDFLFYRIVYFYITIAVLRYIVSDILHIRYIIQHKCRTRFRRLRCRSRP